MSALGILAADNAEALGKLTDAVSKADDAHRRAQEATDGAANAVSDIAQRKMQASYRTAGVSIPRTTYGQAGVGRTVSRNEVTPGDLIIYYADQHHVAMAVDSVRAVHASTEGVPVKIVDIDSIGPINVIRRLEG